MGLLLQQRHPVMNQGQNNSQQKRLTACGFKPGKEFGEINQKYILKLMPRSPSPLRIR
jgi:hypothetical protein